LKYNNRQCLGDLLVVSCENMCHISAVNIMTHADDTNLAVPENADVDISEEFRHSQWTWDNNMIISNPKTKENVF